MNVREAQKQYRAPKRLENVRAEMPFLFFLAGR